MTIDRIAFFSYSQYPSALEQYRIYSPLKQAGIEIIPGIRENQLALEAIDQAPVVLFQRDFSRNFGEYQQLLTCPKFEQVFSLRLPHWQEALQWAIDNK